MAEQSAITGLKTETGHAHVATCKCAWPSVIQAMTMSAPAIPPAGENPMAAHPLPKATDVSGEFESFAKRRSQSGKIYWPLIICEIRRLVKEKLVAAYKLRKSIAVPVLIPRKHMLSSKVYG